MTLRGKHLAVINQLLVLLITLLGIYIIISPLIPNLLFMVRSPNPVDFNPYLSHLTSSAQQPDRPIPKDNRIVIPRLGLDEVIHDSNSARALDKGIWRRPKTQTPAEGGNTVLAGHRFVYGKSSGVFYHLDKLVIGDQFIIYWNQEEYLYTVVAQAVTNSKAVEIENRTETPTVTLYTCTPLWTSQDRLVVQATLLAQYTKLGERI